MLLPVQTYFANIQYNVFQATDNALLQSLFNQFLQLVSSRGIAMALVDGLISSVITMLLLPWGTIAFTGLYLDSRNDAS